MSWWKSKKCGTCHKKIKKGIEYPLIRLQTAEGVIELEICGFCADFYEKSAEVLNEKRQDREESGED